MNRAGGRGTPLQPIRGHGMMRTMRRRAPLFLWSRLAEHNGGHKQNTNGYAMHSYTSSKDLIYRRIVHYRDCDILSQHHHRCHSKTRVSHLFSVARLVCGLPYEVSQPHASAQYIPNCDLCCLVSAGSRDAAASTARANSEATPGSGLSPEAVRGSIYATVSLVTHAAMAWGASVFFQHDQLGSDVLML